MCFPTEIKVSMIIGSSGSFIAAAQRPGEIKLAIEGAPL
jgi:hypothetical protein